MITFTRTDLGYTFTDRPGVEQVIISMGASKACPFNPQTGLWRVSDGYARRVAEALRSRGFTVTGI
jgi:hypothetical protein